MVYFTLKRISSNASEYDNGGSMEMSFIVAEAKLGLASNEKGETVPLFASDCAKNNNWWFIDHG